MRMHLRIILLGCLVAGVTLAGCSNHTDNPGFGTVTMRMTDAPGDFQSVNLVITQVAVRFEGTTSNAVAADSDSVGWMILSNTPATYDLLTLRNGVFTTIGSARVPAGHYTQVRLKIGTGSTVVVNGTTYPLTVPSGAQTGVKLVGGFDVSAGGTTDLALDFDAARSIVVTGVGSYLLKPTIKVLPFSTAGAIKGQLTPAGTTTTSVFAILPPDTVGSTVALNDGRFELGVLAPGTYQLGFHSALGYRDTLLTGVVVTARDTTNVGTVQLMAP